MIPLRVWAPQAKCVELECAGRRLPLRRDGGCWEGEIESADAPYGFVVDGRGPLADPRAPALPRGVFELGTAIDHAAYTWHDGGWQPPAWPTAVVYELHVGTFTREGTLHSAIARLDDLVELGVTHVELMPVHAAPGARGWGYDPAGHFAVHPAYGGATALKAFVDACHARGLAVLLDVVYNHFGPAGVVAPSYAPYLHDRHQTPWGNALNFDGAACDEVRRFVCDNALMWLRDYHCDGLRLDAVHGMPDDSPRHILAQLADEVHELAAELGRPLLLVAESDANDARLVTPRAAGGFGLDAVWSDDFHHALHAVLTGERHWIFQDFGRLADVARALEQGFVYQGQYSRFRRRAHGTSAAGLEPSRFVVALQNHDQVGNRAHGERLGHLIGPRLMQVAAALLFSAPFVPLIFQGEEWNATAPFLYFTDHRDAQLAQQVREGRRAEFGDLDGTGTTVPDPQAIETFTASQLDWDERAHGAHAAMLDWYRSLIRLRAATPEITTLPLSATRTRADAETGTLLVERGPLLVAANLSAAARPMVLPRPARLRLASDPQLELAGQQLTLPGGSVAILSTTE